MSRIQPINTVAWIHRDNLSPNLYNPNKVMAPEMKLLKESILSEGWLFPILVLDKSIDIKGLTDNGSLTKFTIIDGFHRYTVSGDKEVYSMTGGEVPCIILNPANPLAVTVRMNRAKGTHGVMKMAEIVVMELNSGKPVETIMVEYGMEYEEVRRLANSNGIHLSKGVVNTEWSKSWVPK